MSLGKAGYSALKTQLFSRGLWLVLGLSLLIPAVSEAQVSGGGGTDHATVDATLNFSQTAYSAAVGSTITADLVVNSGSNGLSVAAASLTYPPDKLQFTAVSYQDSVFPTEIRPLADTAGTVTLSRANLTNGGFQGTQGLVAQLTFKLITDQAADLTLSQPNSDLRDYSFAENVLSSVRSATVTATTQGGGGNQSSGSNQGGTGSTGSGSGDSGSSGSSNSQSNSGTTSKRSSSGRKTAVIVTPIITHYQDSNNFHNLVIQAFEDKAIISWDTPSSYVYALSYRQVGGDNLEAKEVTSDKPNTLHQAVLSELASCQKYSFDLTLFQDGKTVESRTDSFTTLGCDLVLTGTVPSNNLPFSTNLLIALAVTGLVALSGLFISWTAKILHGR